MRALSPYREPLPPPPSLLGHLICIRGISEKRFKGVFWTWRPQCKSVISTQESYVCVFYSLSWMKLQKVNVANMRSYYRHRPSSGSAQGFFLFLPWHCWHYTLSPLATTKLFAPVLHMSFVLGGLATPRLASSLSRATVIHLIQSVPKLVIVRSLLFP